MQRYLLLHSGFEMPAPEIMSDGKRWLDAVADRAVEHGRGPRSRAEDHLEVITA